MILEKNAVLDSLSLYFITPFKEAMLLFIILDGC